MVYNITIPVLTKAEASLQHARSSIPLFSLNQLKPNSGFPSYRTGRKVDLSHYQRTPFPGHHSPPSLTVIQKSQSLRPKFFRYYVWDFGPCYHCWHVHCSSQSARDFLQGLDNKYFALSDHTASVATTQLCCCYKSSHRLYKCMVMAVLQLILST